MKTLQLQLGLQQLVMLLSLGFDPVFSKRSDKSLAFAVLIFSAVFHPEIPPLK